MASSSSFTTTYKPRKQQQTNDKSHQQDTHENKQPQAPSSLSSSAAAAAGAAAAAAAGPRDKRRDGRGHFQLRPPYLKVGAVSRAAGSAYVEMEGVKVICGVYGPTSNARAQYSDKGTLSCSLEFAPFARGARRTRKDEQEERAISMILEEAITVSIQLDKFPKAVVKAWVVVLEGGLGYLGAAISCVSLALADAGIELYGLVAAASVASLGKTMIVDPSCSETEDPRYGGSMLLACIPSLQQITYVSQKGSMESKAAQDMVALCSEACSILHDLMKECLVADALQKGLQISSDNKKNVEDTL